MSDLLCMFETIKGASCMGHKNSSSVFLVKLNEVECSLKLFVRVWIVNFIFSMFIQLYPENEGQLNTMQLNIRQGFITDNKCMCSSLSSLAIGGNNIVQ